MSKLTDRIAEVGPLTDPPAYAFLFPQAEAISKMLKAAKSVASKQGGQRLYGSIERRSLVEWDAAIWTACAKYGPDEVRVATRCLKKRNRLEFLQETPSKPNLEVIRGGRK